MTVLTTPTSTTGWAPDQMSNLDIDSAIPELFLVKATTKAGEVDGDEPSVRVPYVSVGPSAATVDEGDEITPGDATRAEAVISTRKTAVLSVVSNELMRQPGASARITASLKRAIVTKANADFLAALSAASTGFVNGGTLGGDLDEFSDSIADITANGGEASQIFMPSTAWKTLSKIKQATGSTMPLLGVGDRAVEGIQRSLFGVPVVLSAAADAIYVVSKSDLLSAYGAVTAAVSNDVAFFSDSTAIRATLRFGITAARANRHAKIALA